MILREGQTSRNGRFAIPELFDRLPLFPVLFERTIEHKKGWQDRINKKEVVVNTENWTWMMSADFFS